MIERRGFLKGALAAFAAPAIVSITNIMPVRALLYTGPRFALYDAVGKLLRTIPAHVTMKSSTLAAVTSERIETGRPTIFSAAEVHLPGGIVFSPYKGFPITMLPGDILMLGGFNIVTD